MDGYVLDTPEEGIPLVELVTRDSECAETLCKDDKEPKKHKLWKLGDPMFVTQVLLVWLACIMVFFAVEGLFEGNFFNVGPNDNVVLFGVAINTWTRWTAVMVFNFVDMLLYEWSTEIIRPFVINTVQDHKTEELGMPKWKALFIVNSFELCSYVRFVINIRMIFTQLDFIIAVYLGNVVSENAVTWSYIRKKLPKKIGSEK